jgi:hypothetical protein
MKNNIQIFSMSILMSITWMACAPSSTTNNDTSAISGSYRKNNIAWTGTYGPCEVNQLLTISRNGNDHANIIGSYEVITQPSSGIGAPVVNYVGDYNLTNCTIVKTDDIITINYSYPDAPGDIGIISGVSGSLSGNNLTISVTRGGSNTSTGTFAKQ